MEIWGLLTVIGAFTIHLALGFFYTVGMLHYRIIRFITLGNMTPYLIDYLQISDGMSVWFSAIMLSGQAVGMPTGGFLAEKIGFRLVAILGMFFSR